MRCRRFTRLRKAQATLINLIEVAFYHKDTAKAASDDALLELTDYCFRKVRCSPIFSSLHFQKCEHRADGTPHLTPHTLAVADPLPEHTGGEGCRVQGAVRARSCPAPATPPSGPPFRRPSPLATQTNPTSARCPGAQHREGPPRTDSGPGARRQDGGHPPGHRALRPDRPPVPHGPHAPPSPLRAGAQPPTCASGGCRKAHRLDRGCVLWRADRLLVSAPTGLLFFARSQARLLGTHDAPLGLVPLLEERPWVRRSVTGSDGPLLFMYSPCAVSLFACAIAPAVLHRPGPSKEMKCDSRHGELAALRVNLLCA